MKRQKLALIGILVFFGILLVLLIWRPFLDQTLRKILIDEIGRRMDAQVSVAALHVELFPPRVSLDGLEIKKETGPLEYIGVRNVSIVPGVGPVLTGRLVINNLTIDEPTLRLDLTQVRRSPKKTKLRWMKIPAIRDLIRVDLKMVSIGNVKLAIKLPWQDIRFNVTSGKAGFQGQGDVEHWIWQGKGELWRGKQTLALDDVQIDAERDGGEVSIEKFEVRLLQSRFSVTGKAYPEADLKYSLRSEIAPLIEQAHKLEIFQKSPEVEGTVLVSGNAKGPWEQIRTITDLFLRDAKFKNHDLPSINLSVKTNREVVESVTGGVDLDGKILEIKCGMIKEGVPIFFEAHGKDLALEKILKIAVPSHQTKTRADLNLDVNGQFRLKPFDLNGEYKIASPSLKIILAPSIQRFLPLDFKQIETEGKFTWLKDHGLSLQETNLQADGIRGTYRFDFQTDGLSQGVWTADIDDVSGAFAKDYPVFGAGSSTGNLKAQHGKYRVELNFKLKQLGYQEYGPYPFDGTILFDDKNVEFANFKLGDEAHKLKLNSKIGTDSHSDLNLSASWSSFPLGWMGIIAHRGYPVIEPAAGFGSGTLELNGNSENLSGSISLRAQDFRYGSESFDRLDTFIDIEKGQFIFQKGDLEKSESKLSGRGAVGSEGFQNFRIHLSKFPLGIVHLPPILQKLASHTDGDLTLQGSLDDPTTEGNFYLLIKNESGFKNLGLLSLLNHFSDLGWKLEYQNKAFMASGRLNLKEGTDFQGSGEFTKFSAEAYLPQAQSTFSGRWNLKGDLKKTERMSGEVAFGEASISKGDWDIHLAHPAALTIQKGKFQIQNADLEGPSTQLNLMGSMVLNGEIDAKAQGRLSAGILSVLLKGIARSEGEIEISTQVRGTTDKPQLTGKARLGSGFIQIRNFPHPIEDLSIEASLDQQRIFIDALNAHVAGGKMEVGGEIKLGGSFQETALSLDGKVDRLQFRYPIWLPSTFSGRISLLGPLAKPTLHGDFLVHEAVYRDNWDWKSRVLTIGQGGKRERAARSKDENILFDLLFRSDGYHFYFKNNLATATMRGQMRLTGSDQNLGLLGRVEIAKGEVAFLDNLFEVTSGYVTFDSPQSIKSTFDINAKTKVKDVDILLDIRTQNGDVVAFLSSQPNRDETSIVALLTLGVDVDELSAGNSTNSNFSAAVLPGVLSAPIQSKLETGLKHARIVDTFQFVPFFSESTKTSGLKMMASKQIFPKVKLSYSTDLFDVSSENTVRIEQNVNDHFSIQQSVRDNRQEDSGSQELDVGLDFEFKYEF